MPKALHTTKTMTRKKDNLYKSGTTQNYFIFPVFAGATFVLTAFHSQETGKAFQRKTY